MKVRSALALISLAAGCCASLARAQSEAARLEFADTIRMLDCEPAGTNPCFRAKLNIVNAKGAPAVVQLPPENALAKNMTVLIDGEPVKPFYAAGQDTRTAVRGRVVLVLVDISGSMNEKLANGQTRFAAAKSALMQFIDEFQDGVDQVAIVPFESHNVEPTILGSRFSSSRQQALDEVNGLPRPSPRNNTALYSAVSAGLDVLSRHASTLESTPGGPEVLLVIMTDGRNEILRGDDPGLLDGPAALKNLTSKVRASGTQVIGIGFGDPSQIDEAALRSMSTKLYMAPDAETLKRTFMIARTLLNSRITVTFNSARWPDRASLAGHTLHISAKMAIAPGRSLASDPTAWVAPEIGFPLFAGKCTSEERQALFQQSVQPGVNWLSVLRPILVFAGLVLLLVLLWFWVPRLVWPDQYSGLSEELARWQAPPSRSGPKRRPPPGFTSPGQHVPGQTRTPADATIVQPRTDFSKTRLERDY